MLPQSFSFEASLSVICLTPIVFTNKILVALKAIKQSSDRRTDFEHDFGRHDELVDTFQAGPCLDVGMRHPDC